jgi:valyl-tRNA synthetase
MDKSYDPKAIEDQQYEVWLKEGVFLSTVEPGRERFSIVIPPPNVTGSLHLGHALTLTLPDIIVRWQRMSGKNTLWVPGTDHAGIGTQMVVERELAKEGKKRIEIGREAFTKRAWEWKEYSHTQIVSRIKKLGLSVDWSRERFTLDEGLSRAVREAFVRLYKEGLIHKGEYIVNWCPRCKTAISDLEVKHEQKEGWLYYIRYAVQGSDEFITVATTRPETMLGDTGVAVHPDDERYKHLVGKKVILPLMNRQIPIVADSFVDRQFGTGAVKITPAHDPNDFEAAKRTGLPSILVIDGDAKMTKEAGKYAGLDRFEARKLVLQDLKAQGLLADQQKHQYAVGYCDRCKTIVEPLLSTQWFARMKDLAEPAIRAVEEGKIRFIPENWSKVYFEWMRNIHDWCISRQLWWGHQIPAWYCDECGKVMVELEKPTKCAQCGSENLRQETDVLDTWFSSGLWPFSVFGWPEQTPDLKYYYPTNLLVTGFDIIFFWVARMIMFGLKFMEDVPFREVFIHGLVRDESGQKMSKSKGNVLDPMELIEQYGADALRFTLAVLAVPGPDIPVAPKRIQGYKAFLNKLWNSVRFALMKVNPGENLTPLPKSEWDLGDRWIASRFNRLAGEMSEYFHEYRFDLAANAVYQFLWHEFCDWYIEWIKPHLNDDRPRAKEKKGLLIEMISNVLSLLHPFVPFVSEYLWQQLPDREGKGKTLAKSPYPIANRNLIDEAAETEFAFLMELIGKIRQVRSEMNIEPSKKVQVLIKDTRHRELIERQNEEILLLIRGEKLEIVSEFPSGVPLAKGILKDCEVGINLAALLNVEAEKERLHRELKKIDLELIQTQKKLANQNFLKNAPSEIVEEQKAKHEDLAGRKVRTEETLRSLGG